MALKQPNTLCKNRDCHKGVDGGRKHYYTCRYCAHSENWRAVACSWECYTAYMEQLAQARGTWTKDELLPERTDMTKEEVVSLISETPTEQVIEETEEELAEEMSENPGLGFGDIVDMINVELDAKSSNKKHKK